MSTATSPPASVTQSAGPDRPLVRAKFRAPSAPRHLIRRHRVLALLDALADYGVTAVVAPAGAGKTVLAADWLEHRRGPTTWVTLDDTDRDPTRLWSSLATAIDLVAPGTMTGASRRLAVEDDISTVLPLLRQPHHLAVPVTMVIDDVDTLAADGRAGAVLATFVEHRPCWLHLVVLSRRRLPVPVERLRARGVLADIHFDVLRLAPVEAAALLTDLCPDLGPSELSSLVEEADGWAAAVQLAALARRSRALVEASPPDTSAVPPGKLVDEYLWKEVLGPARAELLDVLLGTAVVPRINHRLAEALTGRPDAGDLLEEAEAAGLFVTSVDREWFEVHSLVRDVLLHRLHLRRPETLRSQHERAAAWFESAGERLAAVDHWLSAERPVDALRALADVALPLVDSGRGAHVLEALDRIPADAATRDPEDAIRYAWCHLAAGRTAFADTLAIAEGRRAAAPAPSRSRMDLLQGVDHWLRGDWPRAAAEARGALAAAGASSTHPVDRLGWRLIGGGVALDERWDEDAVVVSEARSACVRDPSARGSFESMRTLGLALAGRSRDAQHALEDATRTAQPGREEPSGVHLTLAAGIVERELDHRARAEEMLEEVAGRSTHPDPVLRLVAALELVQLRISNGDLAAASVGIQDAERLRAGLSDAGTASARTAVPPSPPSSLVARVGVDLALAVDDRATAVRWAQEVVDPFWNPTCEAKISLARGGTDEALRALERAVPRCPRHEVVAGLLAGQAWATRDHSGATETVGRALALAAANGMLRTVAAEGRAVGQLIELAAWRVPDEWMDSLRRALVPTWVAEHARRPVEDLTDRERDVLRLLPSRLTLGEIATELYVSPNTLKFHLRAIYRKLGVDSRAGAVGAARQMLLLPPG